MSLLASYLYVILPLHLIVVSVSRAQPAPTRTKAATRQQRARLRRRARQDFMRQLRNPCPATVTARPAPCVTFCMMWSRCNCTPFTFLTHGCAVTSTTPPQASTFQSSPSFTGTACTAWSTCAAGKYVSKTGSSTTDRGCSNCDSGTRRSVVFFCSQPSHAAHTLATSFICRKVHVLVQPGLVLNMVDLRCGQIHQRWWYSQQQSSLHRLRQRYDENLPGMLSTALLNTHVHRTSFLCACAKENTLPRPTRARARHGRPALLANTLAMQAAARQTEAAQIAAAVRG